MRELSYMLSSMRKGKVSFSGSTLGIVFVASLFCGAAATVVEATPVVATVATFSDPAVNSSTPLFTLSGSATTPGSTLSGGWTGSGLDLVIPWTNTIYQDATFTMTLLTVTSSSKLSGGQIDFYDNLNNPILQIVFDAADLYAPYVFAASKFEGQNVSFSGPAITFPVLDEEMFSFSFANQVVTPNGRTWTAAFTSSAVIPEPGTLALLVFGTLAMIRRPRN